jgi:hypothetical protein
MNGLIVPPTFGGNAFGGTKPKVLLLEFSEWGNKFEAHGNDVRNVFVESGGSKDQVQLLHLSDLAPEYNEPDSVFLPKPSHEQKLQQAREAVITMLKTNIERTTQALQKMAQTPGLNEVKVVNLSYAISEIGLLKNTPSDLSYKEKEALIDDILAGKDKATKAAVEGMFTDLR